MTEVGKCFCPVCHTALNGLILIDRNVSLVRECPRHGNIKTPLFSRSDYLTDALSAASRWADRRRCLVVEITDRCDVGCATCSASSVLSGRETSAADIVDKALSTAASIGATVVALSGGEPLMRADIWEIADAIHEAVYKVVLITSGRGFEDDPTILNCMSQRSDWLEVYLQFDSLDDEVLKSIRTPATNSALRRRRLALAIATGASVSAVCVVPPEGLEGSVGELARYCRSEGAAGITFQPLRQLGRFPTAGVKAGDLGTIDYIQRLALEGLGSSDSPRPLSQQPLDIVVNFIGEDPPHVGNVFFTAEGNQLGFRVATSSYWDHSNYFEPFAELESFYFMSGAGQPLNARYFDAAQASQKFRGEASKLRQIRA